VLPGTFQIQPYIGAGPVAFGMTVEDVKRTLGPPERITSNWRKDVMYDYPAHDLVVGFHRAALTVDHLGFGPRANVQYKDMRLFSDPAAFEWLLKEDGLPLERVGFVFLLRLGIALTGFHQWDESGKTISVFHQGYHDALRPRMKNFVPRA
jgi:hypothetical protein